MLRNRWRRRRRRKRRRRSGGGRREGRVERVERVGRRGVEWSRRGEGRWSIAQVSCTL